MIAYVLTWYAAALVMCAMLARLGFQRPQLVAILPLLFLDCLGNLLLMQSFHKTLSGEAWNQREHKYFGWCWRAIDAMFFLEQNHCRIQAEREAKYGSVWTAWAASFKQ